MEFKVELGRRERGNIQDKMIDRLTVPLRCLRSILGAVLVLQRILVVRTPMFFSVSEGFARLLSHPEGN